MTQRQMAQLLNDPNVLCFYAQLRDVRLDPESWPHAADQLGAVFLLLADYLATVGAADLAGFLEWHEGGGPAPDFNALRRGRREFHYLNDRLLFRSSLTGPGRPEGG